MPPGMIVPTQLDHVERSPWSGRRLTLSKSKVAAFEHCPKRLWLQLHRPHEAIIDRATQALFAWGHKVGAAACSLHPDGVMVEAGPDITAALEQTKSLLAQPAPVPIFEATFQRDDVVIRADILQPDMGRSWRLIEVKGASRVKSHQLRDIATQAWAISTSGLALSALIIRHLKERADPDLGRASGNLFIDADVTSRVGPLARRRSDVINAARAVLKGPEPVRSTGAHCTRPFTCEFHAYCRQLPQQFTLPLGS